MDGIRFDNLARLFGRRRSRRDALRSGSLALAAALGANGVLGAAAQDEESSSEGTVTGAPLLFVQAFQSGNVVPKEGEAGRYMLNLRQGLGQTIYFSDRPERVVGAWPTEKFFNRLGFTTDNPPNAVLVAEQSPGHTELAALVLYDPAYDKEGNNATYEVDVLAGFQRTPGEGFAETETDLAEMMSGFGAAHLFIDDLLCGDHTVGCYLSTTDSAPVGTTGKRGYHTNYLKNICRPSAGCPELNAICNQTYPQFGGTLYAAQVREGPTACSSCAYSIESLPGYC